MNYLETLTGLIARELTGRERSNAMREFDGFADTEINWPVEPTERDSWLAALGEAA